MPLRDPTPEELKQLIDSGAIDNTQGVGFLTRLFAKNLSASPEQAAAFLQRSGFEVKPVADGSKMQFLVRKVGTQKWGVLDPKGFDLQDLTDLATELLGGTVIGTFTAGGALAGAVLGVPAGPAGVVGGGVLGGVAGGMVGAGGFEAIRQGVGGLAGVNVEPNMSEVQRQLESGALAFPTGAIINRTGGMIAKGGLRAMRRVSKTGANVARNMLGRAVGGVSEEDFLAATRTPQIAKAITSETAPRPLEVLDKIRDFTSNARIPEYAKAQSLLKEARPVRLDSMFKILEQRGFRPIGEERAGVDTARQVAIDIAAKLDIKPNELVVNTPTGQRIEKDIWSALHNVRVPAAVAEDIKQRLQAQVDFSGKPGEKLRNELLKKAQAAIRANITSAMPTSELRANYSDLMSRTSAKMETLKRIDAKIGEWKASGSENVLRGLFREGKSEDRRLFEKLDKQFNQKFVDEIRLSGVASKFSKDAPRLTATGQFLGTAPVMTAGAGIGAAVGGVPGAIAGSAIGGVAGFAGASPKGIIRIGRGVNRTEEAIRRFVGRAGQEVNRIEPLAEQAGFATAGLASRAAAAQPPEMPASYSIDIQGSDADVGRAKQTVDQINAIPGLTPEQRFQKFQELFSAQPGAQPAGAP